MTGWEIKTGLHLQNQLIYALRLCSTHIHDTYTAGAELSEVTKMPLDGAMAQKSSCCETRVFVARLSVGS